MNKGKGNTVQTKEAPEKTKLRRKPGESNSEETLQRKWSVGGMSGWYLKKKWKERALER